MAAPTGQWLPSPCPAASGSWPSPCWAMQAMAEGPGLAHSYSQALAEPDSAHASSRARINVSKMAAAAAWPSLGHGLATMLEVGQKDFSSQRPESKRVFSELVSF